MTRAEFDAKVAELESREDIENAEGQLIDVFAVAEGHEAQVMIELLALNNEVSASIQPYLNPVNLLERAKKYCEVIDNALADMDNPEVIYGGIGVHKTEIVTNAGIFRLRLHACFSDADGNDYVEHTHCFDFVPGNHEFLLLDVDDLGLYR